MSSVHVIALPADLIAALTDVLFSAFHPGGHGIEHLDEGCPWCQEASQRTVEILTEVLVSVASNGLVLDKKLAEALVVDLVDIETIIEQIEVHGPIRELLAKLSVYREETWPVLRALLTLIRLS